MGGDLSRAGAFGRRHRHRAKAFRAEHRLSRGGAAGDHGRSEVERRQLLSQSGAARRRARSGAHGRSNIYDLEYRKPEPVVERANTLEIDERTLADGSILVALDERTVRSALVPQLKRSEEQKSE